MSPEPTTSPTSSSSSSSSPSFTAPSTPCFPFLRPPFRNKPLSPLHANRIPKTTTATTNQTNVRPHPISCTGASTNSNPTTTSTSSTITANAIGSSTSTPPPITTTTTTDSNNKSDSLFRCVVCGSALYETENKPGDIVQSCDTCQTKFPRRSGYTDLTGSSTTAFSLRTFLPSNRNEKGGASDEGYALPSFSTPARQALFQLPQIAFAYERGWRDNFKRAGFPGPEKEVDLALDFLFPPSGNNNNHHRHNHKTSATLLDMSCGTGILTRRIVASLSRQSDILNANTQIRVIAADISHSMLTEASTRARKDVSLPQITFIRADVASMPFMNNSLNAVHAGAALHCWPQLQDGLREVRRVLVPGGRFFATTFAKAAYLPNGPVFDKLVPVVDRIQDFIPLTRSYRFFDKDEIEYIAKAAGFAQVEVEQIGGCIIVKCVKGE